jgi:hypothetical protein
LFQFVEFVEFVEFNFMNQYFCVTFEASYYRQSLASASEHPPARARPVVKKCGKSCFVRMRSRQESRWTQEWRIYRESISYKRGLACGKDIHCPEHSFGFEMMI